MAYPKELNNLYKSEKAAGTTTATSFPEWHKEWKTRIVVPTVNVVNESETPILDELVKTFTNHPTSEEIEAEINSKPLTDVEIAAIIAALTPPTVVVVGEVKKAAKARAIYDEMDAAAKANNVALVRKNIINRFMTELPISKVGASTYLQNIKKAKGLIVHK